MAAEIDASEVVVLDWEKPRSNDEVIESIHRLFMEFDREGQMILQSGASSSASVVKLRKFGSQTLFVRVRKPFMTTKSTPDDAQKIAKFMVVGMKLARNVAEETPEKLRHLKYSTTHQEIDISHYKSLARSWAVTLGIHPYQFGLLTETTGMVYIPRGMSIVFDLVENIFSRDNAGRYKTKRILLDSSTALRHPIPEPILGKIMVRGVNSRSRLDGVIVTEHRNLSFQTVGWEQESRSIVVQTGGFSCNATSSFLNKLANVPELNAKPFIWVSDHDANGFAIYLQLKFGSKSQAFLSPSQATNRLEFFGPTIQHFKDILNLSVKALREEKSKEQPTWSKEQLDAAQNKFEKKHQSHLNRIPKRNVNDRDTWRLPQVKKTIRESGLDETVLLAEIEEMQTTRKGVFCMADLQKLRRAGDGLFLLEAMEARLLRKNEITCLKKLPATIGGKQYGPINNLESQNTTSPVPVAPAMSRHDIRNKLLTMS